MTERKQYLVSCRCAHSIPMMTLDGFALTFLLYHRVRISKFFRFGKQASGRTISLQFRSPPKRTGLSLSCLAQDLLSGRNMLLQDTTSNF